MSEVTLIGLGAMGVAIARTLIDRGCDLTVWNRSVDKAEELRDAGAAVAESLASAIESSPRIMVCIHGYSNTRALLDDPDIIPLLSGRTLVQMSTGAPAEAREAEGWIHGHGGHYLDCSIMVYPPSIGTGTGQILVAGPREVYDDCAGYIDHLGGDIRYLGATIGAAAALDMAIVSRLVTRTVAIVYGVHICESEGVSLEEYASMFPEGDRAHHLARIIDGGDFDRNIQSTVGTSLEAAAAIKSMACDLGINTELPDFILGLYQRAVAAGYRDKDSASLVEVLRGNA
jgi:3-hydroxyisobutyrate dehydrogenase-like beta-hydroxyacid dehydrogenase